MASNYENMQALQKAIAAHKERKTMNLLERLKTWLSTSRMPDENDGSKCCCETHPACCQYCNDLVRDYAELP